MIAVIDDCLGCFVSRIDAAELGFQAFARTLQWTFRRCRSMLDECLLRCCCCYEAISPLLLIIAL